MAVEWVGLWAAELVVCLAVHLVDVMAERMANSMVGSWVVQRVANLADQKAAARAVYLAVY